MKTAIKVIKNDSAIYYKVMSKGNGKSSRIKFAYCIKIIKRKCSASDFTILPKNFSLTSKYVMKHLKQTK